MIATPRRSAMLLPHLSSTLFMLTMGCRASAATAKPNAPNAASVDVGAAARAPAPSPGKAPARAAGGAVSPDDFIARTFDDGAGHTLPYRLFVPRGYDPSLRYPLVVYLHGAGGRGTDNRRQLTDQAAPLVFAQPETQARWPLFMLAPQCPPDQQWVGMPWGEPTGKGKRPAQATWPLAATLALVDRIRAEYPAVDAARTHVTGISMGGFGAWDAAVRSPATWKTVVPVCGGYDELRIAPLVNVAVWAFHAADDPAVPVSRSREIIAALRALHGGPRYTEYPASDHTGHFSWRPAYADPALLPWMFGPPTGDAAKRAPPSQAPPPR